MLTYADELKGDYFFANLYSDQAWQMDVVAMELLSLEMLYKHGGTQFTCFTSTQVQILSCDGAALARNALQALRYSIYLLYWYKSTNTDAEGAAGYFVPLAVPYSKDAGCNVLAGKLVA